MVAFLGHLSLLTICSLVKKKYALLPFSSYNYADLLRPDFIDSSLNQHMADLHLLVRLNHTLVGFHCH